MFELVKAEPVEPGLLVPSGQKVMSQQLMQHRLAILQ